MIKTLKIVLFSFSLALLLSACGGGGGGGATNHAPVLSAVPDVNIVVGNTHTIPLTATDLDNDQISYSISGGSTSTVNGTISGSSLTMAPALGYVTTLPIAFTVTANDGKGGLDTKTFNVSVSAQSNYAPVISAISDVTMTAGNIQTISLTATDLDNDAVSFSASGGSASTVSLSVSGNSLTITPALGYFTLLPITITVTASDGKGGTDSKTFTVSVNTIANHAPTLTAISDVSITSGNTRTISLAATDLDNDTVSFSVAGGSASTVNVAVSGNSLTMTPAFGYVTTLPITFTVTAIDGKGGSDSKSFLVTVATATKIIITLATTGTLPQGISIGAIETTLMYNTNKGLTITEGNISTSGSALNTTAAANVATNGEIIFGNMTGSGFGIGEFATLSFNIAPSNTPSAGDFAIGTTSIFASDNALTNLSSQISVIIQSVTFQ